MHDFEDETPHFNPGSDDCDASSRAIVAWFDGEATSEEMRVARLHLENCLRCAVMWSEWSSARFLWRSVPTPAPPIGLLTRILQTIRLHSLLGTNRASSQRSAPISAERPISRRHSTTPALNGLEISPPPELLGAILDQTTRRSPATLTQPVEMMPLLLDGPEFSTSRVVAPTPAMRRPVWRWATAAAAAVPAFSLWLLVVAQRPTPQDDAVMTAPRAMLSGLKPMRSESNTVQSTLSRSAVTSRPTPLTIKTRPDAQPTAIAAPNGQSVAATPVVPNGASQTVAVVNATAALPVQAPPRVQQAVAPPVAPVQLASMPPTPTAAKVSQKASGVRLAAATPSAPPLLVSAPGASTAPTRATAASHQPANRRIRLARNLAPMTRPRDAVVSSWSGRSARLDGSPMGAVRVAPLASADADEAGAPRLISRREAEHNEAAEKAAEMHAALEAMQNGDSRPEAVRSVVNDYAASLLTENGEATEPGSDTPGVDG